MMRQNLRIPGPTPCPPEVLEAVGRPMINHRGPEFKELIYRVTDRLKRVFETKEDLFILTASGTGVMEAAVVNTLSPGDRVLSVTAGAFGDRFCDIAQVFGAEVTRLEVAWGDVVAPEQVHQALARDAALKAVLVVHNETSTGVTHDLESIAAVVKGEFDKLLLVDAISSLACIPLRTDQWRCDVVGTSSQKGFMVPPGLGFISFSASAWEAHKTARCPRYYYDLAHYKRYLERGQPPWTPNLPVMFGLDVALEMMLKGGMENIFAHHRRVARFTRDGIKALGLELIPKDSCASDTVTAVRVPEGVDGRKLVAMMREEHGVVLAGGQAKLEGKIFRIGHMGYVSEDDVQQVLDALKVVLPKVGFKARVK